MFHDPPRSFGELLFGLRTGVVFARERTLRLRQRRPENLSRSELATRTAKCDSESRGLSASTIEKWEGNPHKEAPRPRTIRLLVEALELTEAGYHVLEGMTRGKSFEAACDSFMLFPASGDFSSAVHPPSDEFELPGPSLLIGRREEQSWLTDRLRRKVAPSISAIWGLGGIGKTALVAWTVQQLRKREPACFPDGIGVVFCQGKRSVEDVLRGILERFTQTPVQSQVLNEANLRTLIRQLLTGKKALVILDNIEPELEINRVMPPLRAAGVHIILTARQMLPSEVASPKDTKMLDLLSPDKALEVLAQCLGDTSAEQMTVAEREAGKQIITLLDCHTLAVTLAGAYAAQRHLDLADLGAELANPRKSLDLPKDEIPQAVRKSFLLSYESLPDTTKRLFAGLAAFEQRDFGREAAKALATALSPQMEADGEVDRLFLRSLVKRSLNKRMTKTSDRIRFFLHPLLHALARSLFEEWPQLEQDQAHRAIASYYAVYTKELDAHFGVALSQQTEVDEEAFLTDEENITSKLKWAHEQPQEDILVAELCLGMRRFWRDHWLVRYSKTYLEWGFSAAVRLARASHHPADEQRVVELARHYGYCLLNSWNDQQLDEVGSSFSTMLQAAQRANDRTAESAAQFFLGSIALLRGHTEEAEQHFELSRRLRAQLPEPDPQEWPLDNITFSQIGRVREHVEVARKHFLEAVKIDIRNDNLLGECINLFSLGQLDFLAQDYAGAEQKLLKPLEVAKAVNFRTAEGILRFFLGQLALEQGRLDKAEAYLQEGLKILQDGRNWREQGWALCYLGDLAQKRGNLERAKHLYQEAQPFAMQAQDDVCLGAIHFKCAEVAELQGDNELAELLYRQALALHLQMQSSLDLARARRWLGRFLIKNRGDEPAKKAEGEDLVRQAIKDYEQMDIPELQHARDEAQRLGCLD